MSEPLKLFRPLGLRAAKYKKQAMRHIDQVDGVGTPAGTTARNGFLIRSNTGDELQRSIVIPPDGLVTTFSTFYGTFACISDNWKGPVEKKDDVYGPDYLLKQFVETGTGQNSYFAALLQGQKEFKVIESFPYYNTEKYRFVRNGSFFNVAPNNAIDSLSYQFPDTWSLAAVFPHAQEKYYIVASGTDFIWQGNFSTSSEIEVSRRIYSSNGKAISGRVSFFEQWLYNRRPPHMGFHFPVTAGYSFVFPATDVLYPFDGDDRRFYATHFYEENGIIGYDRIYLDQILPDPEDIPETHTGAVMPAGLRNILLNDITTSGRPHTFWAFSTTPDRKPILVNVIDLSNADNTAFDGPDIDWFEDNVEERKWRLSIHWHDLETGNTWSITADQFWSLLRSRLINLDMDADWRVEDRVVTSNKKDWFAASKMLRHLFARPNHSFHVPHDTVTFFSSDEMLYSWTRDHGSFRIDKTGIFNETLIMPADADTAGIKPSMYYSYNDPETGEDVYLCVCERLERPVEAVPVGVKGPREVVSCWTGNPLTGEWEKLNDFSKEQEDRIWTIAAAKPAYHTPDSLLLLGVARLRYIDEESNEVVRLYKATYRGSWNVGLPYPKMDLNDPVYGEHWNVDMALFGGNEAKKMARYPTHFPSSSQHPQGPYDGYTRGLP